MPHPQPFRTVACYLLGLAVAAAVASGGSAIPGKSRAGPAPELRGTWLTTTANDAIATPEATARTMRRLRQIGINTVYVECWKNGYTQYPSKVLERTIGVDRRPNLMPQDPSDPAETTRAAPRDLVQETLTAAHAEGLIYIAWFEYGFMAAHKSTDNHLRRMKPEWLSRDINGSEVAPNGFVWMNPLHPESRRFLLDIVLEAVDNYDLDGIQLDDRIVWPHVTMGYDDYTRKVYASEHDGRQPPPNHADPEWMRWRADKVNEYARQFVAEVRQRRPGLVISLSPAVYPWCYEYYCLEWPKWADMRVPLPKPVASDSADAGRFVFGWDEFVPQNYRFSYDAFETTWLDQLRWWKQFAAGRSLADLMPGIRLVGEGADSSWDQLRRSIELARNSGNGGHVHWFSRGVLDVFADQLTALYDVEGRGFASNPHFPADWRPRAVELEPVRSTEKDESSTRYRVKDAAALPPGRYRLVRRADQVWSLVTADAEPISSDGAGELGPFADVGEPLYLLIDRREEMARPRPPRRAQ